MKMQNENEFVMQLLAERFTPFTHHAGPLYAGSFLCRDQSGKVYLTERGTWLFSGIQTDDVHTLQHEQFAVIASPQVVLKHLLSSLLQTLQQFQEHLQRIENGASDPLFLIGYYLTNPDMVVVDALALQRLPEQQELFRF